MVELYCYYGKDLVGTLSFDASLRLKFSYHQDWMNDSSAFPISLSMPFSQEVYDHEISNPFFENLLPEETIRRTIGEKFKIPETNIFQFFNHFGDELAGALAIHKEKPKTTLTYEGASLKELEYDKVYSLIQNGQGLYSQILTEHGMKFSLAGAQEKFPIIFRDGKLWIPLDGQPTTHIIKADMAFRNSQTVLNEYLVMKLAEQLGLITAQVDVIPGDYPLFIIKRFDRTTEGGDRIHQEDFCQAQAIPSQLKYEDKGGPSFKNNYNFLKRFSRQPIRDLKQVLLWLGFNILVGNNDNHSKNLSFLWDGKQPALAPFYDLLSTAVYSSRFDTRMAFHVGGTNQFDKLTSKKLTAFEKEMGLRPDVFVKLLRKLIDEVSKNINDMDQAAKKLVPGSTIGRRLEDLIHSRCESIRKII